MKRGFLKYSIGATILFLIVALFFAPFFVGIYAKYEVANVINNITSPYVIHARLLSTDTGWFRSYMKIKIWLATPQKTTLTGDIVIYNGPLILFKDWRGGTHWYLNWFAAKGNLSLKDQHLDKHIQSELPHRVFVAVRQDLDLNTIVHIHSPEVWLNLKNKKIHIGGITIRFFHDAHHNHIILHSLINDAKLDFPDLKTRFDLQYAALSLDITKDDTGLWSGETRLFIPKAFLLDAAGMAEFDHTTLSTKTDPRDAQHYFDVALHTKQLKLGTDPAGPLTITGFIRHFYDQDLGNYVKMQKYISDLGLPTDLRKQALGPFISQLIQGVSAHITQALLKTPAGNVTAGFSFRFPTVDTNIRPVPTASEMAKNSLGEFRLMAAANLLKQQNILGRTLIQCLNNGWLKKEGNEYIMHIQYTPSHGYLMNGQPWLKKM